MKDFQERRAEIFRRSEKRIAQRRRRNRAIMSCVPLVICIAVLSAVKLPFLSAHKDGTNSPSEQIAMDTAAPSDGASDSVICSAVKIQASGAEGIFSKTVEDPEQIEAITSIIESIYVGADTSSKEDTPPDCAVPSGSGAAGSSSPGDNKAYMVYTITVELSDGSERSYTVSDERFTDVESGVHVLLSDAQLQELMSLLSDSE